MAVVINFVFSTFANQRDTSLCNVTKVFDATVTRDDTRTAKPVGALSNLPSNKPLFTDTAIIRDDGGRTELRAKESSAK